LLIVIVCIEAPSTSDSRMNSWRLSSAAERGGHLIDQPLLTGLLLGRHLAPVRAPLVRAHLLPSSSLSLAIAAGLAPCRAARSRRRRAAAVTGRG